MPPKKWQLSASCISAFKSCPTRFRLAYREGLRPAEDTEAQRTGSNWHTCQEIAKTEPGHRCVCINQLGAAIQIGKPECPICHTTRITPNIPPLERVVAWLNFYYAGIVPSNIDKEAWEIERVILAYSMAGWLWYYQNDGLETVATEIKFRLPFRNPATGRALPNVELVGKIDRIVRDQGRLMNYEAKSTTKSVDSDSTFWQRLNLDTQVSTYICASRFLQQEGRLTPSEPLISGTLYDAWHKPGIRPKKLTQAESKAFVETGEYFGQMFKVAHCMTKPNANMPTGQQFSGGPHYLIDDIQVEVEPGKKEGTFAIRETPDMFGARLLQDIVERPEFYFARREIARTDEDLKAFAWELYFIYQTAKSMEKNNRWWHNESQCEATFRCPYCQICWHKQQVCDGHTTPSGFRRIFDLETPVTESD